MVLLKRLLKDGAPIHGVGIQGHWRTATVPYEAIDKAIRDYASLGLKVSITELDVTIRGAAGGQFGPGRPRVVTPPSPEDLQAQADAYTRLFAIFVKHKDVVERVTFWGLSDRRTWRYGQHPLIFDADNRRKPAYAAIVDAVRAEPRPAGGTPRSAQELRRQARGIERGKVEAVEYESKTAGAKRTMLVYTPPGFSKDAQVPGPVPAARRWGRRDRVGEEGGRRRHPGQPVRGQEAGADDRRHAQRPGCQAGRETGHPFAGFDAFEKDLLGDVIPYVEAQLQVKADREHRTLAGLSMGGLQTLDIGLTHLDTFASLGVFSSGWFPDRREKFEKENQELLKAAETNKKLKLFWIANGKPDIAYKNNQAMLEMFDRYGVKYVYQEGKGGHTWDSWKNHLYVFAPLLFRDGK